VVADVAGHEGIQKLKGAVVDGQTQNAHVVGVHHTMTKPHGLPVRHQGCRALAHGPQQRCIGVATRLPGGAAGRVMPVDHIVGQRAQLVHLATGGEMLEMAETDKALRHPGHHGSGFNFFAAHGRR
jgi:hypothetical protein